VRCEKSLAHSLRLSATGIKKLEWKPELTNKNRIWINGHIYNLNALSEDFRQELLYQIAPAPAIHQKKRLQNRRKQYKARIKKVVISELKNGNQAVAEYLQRILDIPNTEFISYKHTGFDQLQMTRQHQRIALLDNYSEAHNLLRQSPANANNVYVQESIFKIPHRWKIGTDIISVDDYLQHMSEFVSEYFSTYKIQAIVGHDDERQLEENTGAHAHLFLSGKNSFTGNFDLHKHQILVVNEYIKANGNAEDILPKSGNLDIRQSVVFGEYFQRMFYQYTNQNLLNCRGLSAEIASESERKSEQRRAMNREARLPKSLRSHNLASREAEIIESKCDVAHAKLATISAHYDIAVKNLYNAEQAELEIKQQISAANEKLLLLHEKCTSKEQEITVLSEEIGRVSSLLLELKTGVATLLSNIIRDIYVRTVAREKGIDSAARSFFKKIMINFEKLSSALFKELCIDVSKAVSDNDLVNAMKKSQDSCELH